MRYKIKKNLQEKSLNNIELFNVSDLNQSVGIFFASIGKKILIA